MSITKPYKSRAIKCRFWNDALAAKKLEFSHESKTSAYPTAARRDTRAHRSGHLYKMLQYVRQTLRRPAGARDSLRPVGRRRRSLSTAPHPPRSLPSGDCHRRRRPADLPDEIKFQYRLPSAGLFRLGVRLRLLVVLLLLLVLVRLRRKELSVRTNHKPDSLCGAV